MQRDATLTLLRQCKPDLATRFGVTGLAGELVWRPLPLQLPTVHVDALWHQRRRHGAAHEWLRSVLIRSAQAS